MARPFEIDLDATAVMMPWGSRSWQRALVMGLGLSGRAAARFLLDHGIAVLGVDDKPAPALSLGSLPDRSRFELAAGGLLAELPADIDGVVLSPGVPPDRPLLVEARRRNLPVIAEIELAAPFLTGPVAAITGSNGKSTTTALTGAMVAASGKNTVVCGNIGEPLTEKVEGPPGRAFVVELSSFQLEGIATFKPTVAALLNLAPDHLDRYGGLEAYGAAERRIFMNQGVGDIAVLNADDPWVAATETRSRRRFFSRLGTVEDGCHLAGDTVFEIQPGLPPRELFKASTVPLAGVHNLENAMASALLALALGATPGELRRALVSFRGLPHRLEKVTEWRGVAFYNDSKGTNPAAVVKSLEGFGDGRVHLILGGRNKGADPLELAAMAAKKARRLYLIGEAAEEFERALGPLVPSEPCGTLREAVIRAAAEAKSGEAVVLSPACASFDQFKNYADRGEQFVRLVREITATNGKNGGGHG